MTISVTLSFATEADMLAFFAGKSAAPAAKAAPAPSPRTAEATPAAAPAASETKVLDFDKDVVPALKSLSTKDKAAFAKLMGDLNCKNVKEVQAKPAAWAAIVEAAT